MFVASVTRTEMLRTTTRREETSWVEETEKLSVSWLVRFLESLRDVLTFDLVNVEGGIVTCGW